MIYTSPSVYECISKKSNDPIVEWKTCRASGTQFPIYKSDLDFYNKISPTFAGEKFQIPTPTLCPEERQRRRLSFRNERKLYKRICDASGRSIISIYSPDKSYKVYDQKIRWSDSRNPMDYARDFDFTKSFTEQFAELMRDVPRIGLVISSDASENNCLYVSYAGHNKDCYCIFDSDFNQNCLYGNVLKGCKDCVDSGYSAQCENSHGLFYCAMCFHCYNCKYTTNSSYCKNCISCINCEYCTDCFGLKNRKYCIANIQYSESEYFSKLDTRVAPQITIIKPAQHITLKDCDSVYGSGIMNSKNVSFTFDGGGLEDVKYCTSLFDAKNVMDIDSFGDNLSYSYDSTSCGHNVFKAFFSTLSFAGSDNHFYCMECVNSSHLFGCIGLRNKSYCIFNKQYTKEEYEIMVGRIIRHMQMPILSPGGIILTRGLTHWRIISIPPVPFSFRERGDAVVRILSSLIITLLI